ncbi:hypothetical protein L6R53_18160 [Myxococcota bacterium]|nr:hypothetical protein [Myxococcota bacterium]
MAGPAPMSPLVCAEFHHDAAEPVRAWVEGTITRLARGPLAMAGVPGDLVAGMVAGVAGEAEESDRAAGGPVQVAVALSDDLVEVRILRPDTDRSDLLLVRR